MREDLPPWTEEDERPHGPVKRPAPRPWILVLGLAPWLVIIGLVLTGATTDGSPGQAGPADHPPAGASAPDDGHESVGHAAGAHASGDTPTAEDAHVEFGSPGPGNHRPGSPETLDDGRNDPGPAAPVTDEATHGTDPDPRIVATALLVARAWVTDVGPPLEVPGIRPRADAYLEHASVEHVDVAGDHAVVTLSTVVLEREDDAYVAASPRRLGVPLTLGDPPRPAGEPWWLPDAELVPSDPDLVGEHEPDVLLALGEELAARGTGAGEVLEAGRTPDGWWVVTAEPVSGGGHPPVRIWLPPAADRGWQESGDGRISDDEEHE